MVGARSYSMNKKVDIIIPVHNRPEHTRQTLESLCKNTPHELYNLYVVDDGSDEETQKVLWDFFAAHHSLTEKPWPNEVHGMVNSEAIGPARSRNNMCRQITIDNKRAEYLYHSDNDVFFAPGWLEKLITAIKLRGNVVKVIGGGCHPYLQNKEVLVNEHIKDLSSGELIQIGIKDAVSGYSQLMTWETWDKYGPFDEGQGGQEIKIMGSEDWAFCQRIIKDGFLVGSIEPEVVIATGKTNTYGKPATGVETFKDHEGIMVK
jgi:GT2 family glycosyltransferase